MVLKHFTLIMTLSLNKKKSKRLVYYNVNRLRKNISASSIAKNLILMQVLFLKYNWPIEGTNNKIKTLKRTKKAEAENF